MKLGWHPDAPDHRDIEARPPLLATQLPVAVDMRAACPPVYDQKSLGSCTAQAVSAIFQFTEMEQRKAATPVPSRLFVYYNTRLIRGSVKEDSGASIREAMKALAKYGACREVSYPYTVSKFAAKPPKPTYQEASVKIVKQYQRVKPWKYDIQSQLAANNPVAFGISLYESFMNIGKDGIVPMPHKSEGMIGGHAIVAVGYTKDFLICRNSWGPKWGDKGHFYLPWEYALSSDLADDFWTLKEIP